MRDVLLIGPWRHETDRSRTQRRAPTDYDAEHTLLRFVRCVNGEVQLTMDCEPVFNYGRDLGHWEYDGADYRKGICRSDKSDVELILTADINIGFEGPRAVGRTLMKEGQIRFVALSWGGREPPETSDDAYKRLVWTAHHWQHWLARGHFPDHPWRSYLERSALTLKGLIYAPTGAVVAAPTTSLPETPGGERNWDYRYSWIRDSTLALWGLYTLGFDWEARDFLYFVAEMAGERRSAGDVRRRRGAPARGADPRPSGRLRGCVAGARRQCRIQATPARRLGRDARLGAISTRRATALTSGCGPSSCARCEEAHRALA